MDDAVLDRAESILGHTFGDRALLEESLTHASVADDRLDSNERMEFLGDSVLDLIVCEELFRRFPEAHEGELTKVKSAVVSRRTCAEVAFETGLADCLRTGKGMGGADLPNSLAANVYEAVVAAIFLDAGFPAAERYVRRTMLPKIKQISDDGNAHNYKSLLQQACQRLLGSTPLYEVLDEKGPDHSKCFEVCVSVDGRRFPGAWGPTKKIAEQKAAILALGELGEMADDALAEAIDIADAAALVEV